VLRDIDQIIELLVGRIPDIQISQLKVTHPADDDGLWFIKVPERTEEVQIESSSGNCPFVIESNFDNESYEGASVHEVAENVLALLSKISAS